MNEAKDYTRRNITASTAITFGGKTVVIVGDFRKWSSGGGARRSRADCQRIRKKVAAVAQVSSASRPRSVASMTGTGHGRG
jgi:hypothetical protein